MFEKDLIRGLLLLVAGLCFLLAGLRGRLWLSDPRCRKCGFNLYCRPPDSTRCPECGADLQRAGAIAESVRRSIVPLVVAGYVLLAPSAVLLLRSGWRVAVNNSWAPWKPTRWLLADLESRNPIAGQRALDELVRRLALSSLSDGEVNLLVDRALDYQEDRSRFAAWPNHH